MEKQGDSGPGGRRPKQSFKSFAELAHQVRKSGDDLELYVYPSLSFGAVWWIPDQSTGFGAGTEHPWVIVVPYREGYPVVVACPRTSQLQRQEGSSVLLPAGVVPSLDRDGVILLQIRRTLIAADFRYYRHAGFLPEEWQQRLRDELIKQATRIAGQSEEP